MRTSSHAARSHHRLRGTTEATDPLPISRICSGRRLDELQRQLPGSLSRGRQLRGETSQWREARGPSGHAIGQIRAGDQPQNLQGAGARYSSEAARARRRGHRVRRREFNTLLTGAAVTWPLAARAQQADPVRQVGMLLSGTADDAVFQTWVGAFLQGLAQSGWIIGGNVRIETRWAGSKADDIRRYAQELVALAPDVILAHGGSTVRPLLQSTRSIPIVFTIVTDPVGNGYVESLARPGRNATGFMLNEYSLNAKYPELLKEIAPGITQVAVLRDASQGAGIGDFAVIQAIAPLLRMQVTGIDLREGSGLKAL